MLVVMQSMLVVVYRHFGTAYQSNIQESSGPRPALQKILCKPQKSGSPISSNMQ